MNSLLVVREAVQQAARVVCAVALSLGGLTACGGSDTPTTPVATIKTLQVVNLLAAPVVISVDGTSQGAVQSGATSTLGLTVSAKTLTVTLSPFQYGDGSFVPNDAPPGSFTLGSTDQQLVINNIVGTQAYIAFKITNLAPATVSIGLVTTTGVRCLGTLPVTAVQVYGYYLLTPTTEVREYAGAGCAGAFKAWTNAQVSAYQTNSGFLTFSAT